MRPIVVGPIGIDTVRAERRRRTGHAMPAHLRPEAYPRAREPGLPPATTAPERRVEAIEERIRASARRIGW